MSRFLIVVPPLAGHTLPTLAVAAELTRRGHEVVWTGPPQVRSLLPGCARLFETDGLPPVEVTSAAHGLRGAAAFQFLWDGFLLPLARVMVPGVDAAVNALAPDVLLVDQQALAGAVVAQRHGLPWATSATTSAELVDPFALMPKLGEWALERMATLGSTGDLRFSEHLVLAFTTSALVGAEREFPPHYSFVGPSIGARPPMVDFPYGWLDPARPHVLVSLGTVNAHVGGRFFAAAAEAFAGLDAQAVIVAPHHVEAPANVLVRAAVPQLDLLRHIHAVVSHAGHNTVCEALAHGVPLVVAPIRDDQPIVAQQVVDAGAGVRVKFGRVSAGELAAAVTEVLTEPSYRAAAARVSSSFASAGGASAAADRLEKLS